MGIDKKVSVRKAARKDIGAIIEVLKSTKLGMNAWVGNEKWTRKTLKQVLNLDNYVLLVAEHDQKIVGFIDCCVYPSFWDGANQGIINHLFVNSVFQTKGAGAMLLKTVIKEADTRRLDELHVSTERENIKAQRLYARAGFTEERLLLERTGK